MDFTSSTLSNQSTILGFGDDLFNEPCLSTVVLEPTQADFTLRFESPAEFTFSDFMEAQNSGDLL